MSEACWHFAEWPLVREVVFDNLCQVGRTSVQQFKTGQFNSHDWVYIELADLVAGESSEERSGLGPKSRSRPRQARSPSTMGSAGRALAKHLRSQRCPSTTTIS